MSARETAPRVCLRTCTGIRAARMERIWSPAGATSGKQLQTGRPAETAETVEQPDRVFAPVYGEVAVVAVDHSEARSHVARAPRPLSSST
jgi:hypothetical protein